MFDIILPNRVEKELSELSDEMHQRVIEALTNLKKNPHPHNTKQLKGKLSGSWRIRIGHYRIIYEIHYKEKRIIILKIGPRKDVYR